MDTLDERERAGGVSLFRLPFTLLFARLLTLFTTLTVSHSPCLAALNGNFSFVFPSLFRLLLFASRFFSPRATLWLRARYDLAVSCFLLTVLRHKICCSGCCWYTTSPFPPAALLTLSVSIRHFFTLTLGARLHTCCCVRLASEDSGLCLSLALFFGRVPFTLFSGRAV